MLIILMNSDGDIEGVIEGDPEVVAKMREQYDDAYAKGYSEARELAEAACGPSPKRAEDFLKWIKKADNAVKFTFPSFVEWAKFTLLEYKVA